MTTTDTWSSLDIDEERKIEAPLAIKVFSYLQIVMAFLAMILGANATYVTYLEYNRSLIPLVGLLGTLMISTLGMFIIAVLMIRVALALRTLEEWSFPWIIYGNLILILLSILAVA